MVRKKLATIVAALGTLQAGLVSALGMGELSLQSALNQPLAAEINILNTGDLDDSQVLVGLAGATEFQNAGVSRDFFLTNIKFDVQLDGNGGGVIKLTSTQPVVEPYLNFLVETRWPSGRLLREYTVLLDLPVFSESQAKPINAPRASARTPVRRPAPVAAPAAASVPVATATQRPRSSSSGGSRFGGELEPGGQYRVNNDETLWVIASKARPTGDISVQQTMVGIQRLNPNAFARGNINRLKAGSVLRLPTEDDLADISRGDAIEEVANQNRAWRSGTDGAMVADNRAQLDATSRRFNLGGRGQAQDRLSIAAAGSSQIDQVGDGEGSGAGTRALRDQLMQSQEMLDKSNREKDELQSRLDDVEAKLATLQRLLELKDNQLAAMQNAQVAAQDGADAQPLVADADPTMAEQPEADMVADTSAPVDQPDVPAQLTSAQPSLLDRLLGNPLYLGGAGLLMLAAVAVTILRRRRGQDDEFDLDDDGLDELSDVSFDEGDILDTKSPILSLDEEPDVADQLVVELEQEIAADNAAAEQGLVEQTQPETGDAIAEADIYVAYGRYQQAVDLLRSAISSESDRSDLQLKLLEVYIETRDKPAFQQQYLKLAELGDEAAIGEVKEMLSSVDGVADWLDGLTGAAEFTDADMDADLIEGEEELALDLDEDLSLDLDDEHSQTISADVSDFESLDLDLDLEDDSGGQEIAEQPDSSDDLGDFDLDLDLDESDELSLDADESLQLDDIDLEFDRAETEARLDTEEEDEGFALDLDSDGDFDLDFADLAENTDLGDLASEFGDTFEEKIVTPQALEAAAESDGSLDLDGDFELSEKIGLNTGAMADETFEESMAAGDAGSEEFDFLSDTDEVATKLDLARAYIDMGDTDGAKDILDEVLQEGSDEQKQEADSLIERIE